MRQAALNKINYWLPPSAFSPAKIASAKPLIDNRVYLHTMERHRYVQLRPALPEARVKPDGTLLQEPLEAKRRRVGVAVACNTCRRKKIRVRCVLQKLARPNSVVRFAGLHGCYIVRWTAPDLLAMPRTARALRVPRKVTAAGGIQ